MAEDAELDGAPAPTDAVCTKGRYRCFASLQAPRPGLGIRAFATPQGYGPPELQSAYKINPNPSFETTPTIGIVGAYGYTALESDLTMYRTQYGLPACTTANGCLKIVNQRGQTAPLPPNAPVDDDWTIEAALDLDMASAACPKCKLLVVQSDDTSDGLFIGQNAAVNLGATVISNSWGGPESPGVSLAFPETFLVHPGIPTFVAAGDDGFNDGGDGPDYPATSQHVIAVGGTRLLRDTSARGWTETAWSKGGSACSLSIPKPAYQTTSPCGFKATADIAAVGDPATGMAVYNARSGGWRVVGGTSASSPLVAAIFAATGTAAQASGPFIAANTAKLFDVTVGNNSNNGPCGTGTLLCNAGAGWDGPTGYGTPNATALGGGTSSGPDIEEPDDGSVSGGCTAGGGAGVMLGVALLGLRRRRR